MLSRDQAHAIADGLLDQAQSLRLESRKSKVRPVAMAYRCRELTALEPWQRTEVVKQATKAASSNLLLIVVCFIGFLALVGLFGRYEFSSMAPFIIAFYVATFLLRVAIIRRKIREMAAGYAFSGTESNSQG
nr:hypothetical protein [uncultured Albidiferax sp.]